MTRTKAKGQGTASTVCSLALDIYRADTRLTFDSSILVNRQTSTLGSMAELEALHPGWSDGVRRVQTPSGGFHLYFVSKSPLATTASKVGPGLDTRGVGGYVVAAGSMIADAGPYVDVVDLLS